MKSEEPRKEPKEVLGYWVECDACGWESETFRTEEELPSSCPECSGDSFTEYRAFI